MFQARGRPTKPATIATAAAGIIAAAVLAAPIATATGGGSEEFLYDVRSAGIYSVSDYTLLDVGMTMCSYLDTDPTPSGVDFLVTTGVDSGIDGYSLGTVIGAAVDDLCPRHLPVIQRYLDGSTTPSYPVY